MSFVGEMAKVFDKLGPHPNLAAWLSRMHARPAFERSVEARARHPGCEIARPAFFTVDGAPGGAGGGIRNPTVAIRNPHHILHKNQADTAIAWPVPTNMLIGDLCFRPPLQDRPQPP